jgi:ABC-type transport system substrate-binding protein
VLNEIGYHATLHRPFRSLLDYGETVFKGHAQIGMLGYGSLPDGSVEIQDLTCNSESNPGRYCNRHIDALYRAGLTMEITNPEAARSMWTRLDKALVNDAAIVPMWWDSAYALVSTRVGNWFPSPTAGEILNQLWVK